MVEREYTGVIFAEEEDDGLLPSRGIAEPACRDCFGASALFAGFEGSMLFALGYAGVADCTNEVFLVVRSPSGAIVHDNSPAYDTITVLIQCFGSAVCFVLKFTGFCENDTY